MDNSEPAQKPSGKPSEEQIQLVPVSVQLSSPNSTDVTPSQPEEDSITVTGSTSAPSGSENIPSHTSSNASHHPSAPAEETLSCVASCCGPASCASQTKAAAVGPWPVAGCATPTCLSQTQAAAAGCPAVAAVLQTESELPGPSGVPPAGGAPTRPSGALCCAAPAPPCHVLSLPDMRLARADCEAAVVVAAAAASSEPTTAQVLVPRPSAGSGIRAVLQSAASHTSFASPLSSIGPFCRICHEGESREMLISPCRCAGSVGLVHVSCIEKWLSAANKDSCEICMYKYVTDRRPKPLFEWLLNPSNPEDARNLVGDVICFFLLTALAVIAAYLCLMGASHYLSYKTQWEATGLVVLGLLISTIYCIWLVVTCRYHCRVWQDWRRTHQDVYLLEMKRRSHSAADVNNNNATVSLAAAAAARAGCRACRGGSYSCSHCCAVCPHHAVQLDATATTAAADDVFEDVSGGSGICGATLENDSAGAEK